MKTYFFTALLLLVFASCQKTEADLIKKDTAKEQASNSEIKTFYHQIYLCNNVFGDATSEKEYLEKFQKYLFQIGANGYQNLEFTACESQSGIMCVRCEECPSGNVFKFDAPANYESLFNATAIGVDCLAQSPVIGQQFYYEILPCQNNPFMVDYANHNISLSNALSYLQSNGVTSVLSSAVVASNPSLCNACVCPIGKRIEITVKQQFINQMIAAGFTQS